MPQDTQHSAAMMMAGLNLIPQALSIYDSDLRLVVSNRVFREMFDLPAHLIQPGTSFAETIRHLVERGEYGPVDDIDAAVQQRVEQARAFEQHYMERTRANGQTIAVEGVPLPEGGWITVYTDITQTKQQETLLRSRSAELSDKLLAYAEELSATNRALAATISALEEAKRQLTATEARTRQTTEMMPAHIAHVGRDMTYTFSNRRLNAIIPGRSSDIVGLNIREALGESAYSHIGPKLQAAFQGTPSTFEFYHEDSSRRIRTAFTPDRNAAGEIVGVYILSTDVTEETQARSALQQTRRRELAAQLISGMAHDFSNLLTIILGSQSRLQRLPLPEPAPELVAATLGAARRGGALLNRIGDITGSREWHPQPTDLGALLHDLETLAAPALPQGMRLDIFNSLGDDRLMLEPGMLQDALLNLFLNARDAMGSQGVITLTVTPVRDTWTEFTVTDTGPGFSEAALAHAFQPFFTTKGGEGSGLGLAMVYDTCKLAGGTVRLGNAPGGGGQVTLRLPLRHAPAPVAPGLVLLVEDSDDLRAGIRGMLTDLGHTVIEATSVDEALTLLGEVPGITLILSDISLEGDATGLDLLQRLPPNAPPRIMMTSLPPEHPLHRQTLQKAPVLRKPFSARELGAYLYPHEA